MPQNPIATYKSRLAGLIGELTKEGELSSGEYIPGRVPTPLHTERSRHTGEPVPGPSFRATPGVAQQHYEDWLFRKLTERPRVPVFLLFGDLGSGKSTAVRHVLQMFERRRVDLARTADCRCEPECVRKPIRIDCNQLPKKLAARQVRGHVLNTLRNEVHNALFSAWLAHLPGSVRDAAAAVPGSRDCFRSLLLLNDVKTVLQNWGTVFELPRNYPVLFRTDFVTKWRPSLTEITQLVKKCRPHADRFFGELKRRITEEKDFEESLTSALLTFYLDCCSPHSPLNLIVVDNLDRYPSRHIELLLDQLSDLAVPHLRLLVPLRPSSIASEHFTKHREFAPHYSASPHEVILRRLQKSVLTLTRTDWSAAGWKLAEDGERDANIAFVATIYVYASILYHVDEVGPPPIVSADYDAVRFLNIPEEHYRRLARTWRAMTGISSRFAIQHLYSFLDRITTDSAIPGQLVASATDRVISPERQKRSRYDLSYGDLVEMVLGEWDGTAAPIVVNVFTSPAGERTPRPERPSLTKLRILRHLSSKDRATVEELAVELASHGVPSETTIAALNELHAEERYLLWFGRNDSLRSRGDFSQEVAISSNGRGYWKDVAADFEYQWFAATRIPPRPVPDEISARIALFEGLISRLAELEQLQVAFRTLIGDHRRSGGSEGSIVLPLAYGALRSVLPVAASVAQAPPGARYPSQLCDVLNSLLDTVLGSQDSFRRAWPGLSYLDAYAELLRECEQQLKNAIRQPGLAKIRERADRTITSWSATSGASGRQSRLNWHEELARFPIAVRQDAEVLKSEDPIGIHLFSRYLEERAVLREDLERCLLSPREITEGVGRLQRLWEPLSTRLASGAISQWVSEEVAFASKECGEVNSLASRSLPTSASRCTPALLDGLKRDCNVIIDITERVARRLGSREATRFGARWQDV